MAKLNRQIILGAVAMAAVTTGARADVLISFIADMTLTGGIPKIVEIKNTGGTTVDLSTYSIKIASNGAVAFTTPGTTLSGNLPAGGTYVIASELIQSAAVIGETPDLAGGSPMNFNGDDTFGLFGPGDVLVDIVGALGVDGTGQPWEHLDSYMFRNSGVTAANTTWTQSEWTQGAVDALDGSATVGALNGFFNSTSGTIYPINPLGGAPIPPTDVANIAAAMAESNGTEVRITGTVIVTSGRNLLNASANRNQFYVQDASGVDGATAILVDDAAATITTNFVAGDTIVNLQGSLTSFGGTRQLTPTANATSAGTTTVPAPLVVTGAITDINSILSELVRVDGVTIAETGTWAADSNYVLTSGSVASIVDQIRMEDASTAVGQTIPAGPFSVTGISTVFSGTGQVQPRFDSDISASASVESWQLFQ